MSDRLHDHETIGIRRGCVACAQTEADMACGRRQLEQTPVDRSTVPAPVD